MNFDVEIRRSVTVTVQVEAESPAAALTAVDLVTFELPAADQWEVVSDSYEMVVRDDNGDIIAES